MKSFLFKGVIPLVIIALGVGGAIFLKNQASKADYQEPKAVVTPVETITATPVDMPATITATGSVTAARQVSLTPEVTGRIVKLSENLIPGSMIEKGEIIARIDKRDFQLALTQEKSRVQQAQVDLAMEHGRSQVARQEWDLLSPQLGEMEEPPDLALRKPQLDAAKHQTQSARSGLDKARLNLKRTVLRAPFNAVVLDKKVDLGQLVGPNTSVATLIGSDELWVIVSIPMEQLPSIDIPGVNAQQGSSVVVTQRIGPDRSIIREGTVIRLKGQLDSQNRTAGLIVTIKDPFSTQGDELPLLPGAYVEVTIRGRALEGVHEIPREALRDGSFVWVAGPKDTLVKREVTVGFGTRDNVVITSGIESGARIITSPLFFPIEGMAVREGVSK